MPASLALEAIGDDARQMMSLWNTIINDNIPQYRDMFKPRPSRQWVARIVGKHPKYGYAREFLRGHKDYNNANKVGSRGVMVWYTLEDGELYEIQQPVSWRKDYRWFGTVREGRVVELTTEEVKQWLAAL